jgi:RNA polymerase sigma-54 factor
MHLNLGMNQRLEQRQHLAPRMIQSMEILQMPILALQEKLQQELLENPVLELQKTETTTQQEPAVAVATDYDRKELVVDPEHAERDFERLDTINRDWEDHFNEEHRPSRAGLEEASDKKHEAMQNMASRPPSLGDYLDEQLAFLDLQDDLREHVDYLVANLDENGYLSSPLEELGLAHDPPLSVTQIEEALHVLQKLDPPGIGARNLKECLLLQLTPEMEHVDILRVLIQNHLEDIQHNRLPHIQKRTDFDLPDIKEAIEELRTLDPRPGRRFVADSVPHVVPDILVERTDSGEYTVKLLDDWLPRVTISPKYQRMLEKEAAEPGILAYVRDKIDKARWLQEMIEQRRKTLEKVTKAIIQHQRNFLDLGPDYIEPLKMQQIADQVKVHVTTVSRAVDDKWVQTPRGLFPLKRFFGGGRQTTSGEDVAYETIKRKLQEIIDGEDKANPLSDEELVDKLKEAGYPVARRTVTKYRKMLKIPSSRQRKEWASS